MSFECQKCKTSCHHLTDAINSSLSKWLQQQKEIRDLKDRLLKTEKALERAIERNKKDE